MFDAGVLRRRRRWEVPALVAGALAAAALAGCGGSASESSEANVDVHDWGALINAGGKPVRGGTLKVDTAHAPNGISPLAVLKQPSNEGLQVVSQMFDQLVELLPGSLDPQPGLAKSWEVSKDGLSWTFHLRAATFSNGMPVTSADVKFLLEYAAGPESFSSDQYASIERIETPDPATVVLKLSEPTPGLLFTLANPTTSIVPAKVVKEQGQKAFDAAPIGSGPFMLKRWRRDQEVELVRNPNYWRKGQPYLDGVRLIATPNDNTRVLNIESGTVDVADSVPFSQIKRLDASGKAKVLVAPSSDMTTIIANNSKPPFDETEVRQALAYATPVKSIVDVVFAGKAPRMNTVMPKLKYWTDKAKAYPLDVDKAKALLAKSSVPDGFSATLQIDGSDQQSSQIAQILKEAWAKIGVTIDVRPLDETTRGDNFVTGKYELTFTRPGAFTSDVPVDDQFARILFASPETNNLFTYYKNPVTEKLAREAVVETDEDKRAQLFEQLHVASMKDPPVVPLVYTPNRAAVGDDVRDFNYMLGGVWRLGSVWIDK